MTSLPLDDLRARVTGPVAGPGDDGWDAARGVFNLTVDQRPAAVVAATSADDVAATVRWAGDAGARVTLQSFGHGAAAYGDLDGVVLVRTQALSDVKVDPDARTARAEAGAQWGMVAHAAGAAGLAGLSGSSPGVGVLGYTLGGGIGWLGRDHGMACHQVRAFEVVTADGEQARVDATTEPDLFWALRGGGGSFAAVTAVEFGLVPLTTVFGGAIFWPWERSAEVLRRYVEWAAEAPASVSASARIMQFPPAPFIPEPLRGRQLVGFDGVVAADEDEARRVVAPLFEIGPPVVDTWATIPAAAMGEVHGDPQDPVPGMSDSALVAGLDEKAVDALVEVAGPESGSPLTFAELRQLGGALGEPPADAGALGALKGDFALYALGAVFDPAAAEAIGGHLVRVREALSKWDTGRVYLNFTEHAVDPARAFEPDALGRLRAIKAKVDPDNRFRANHQIDPAG